MNKIKQDAKTESSKIKTDESISVRLSSTGFLQHDGAAAQDAVLNDPRHEIHGQNFHKYTIRHTLFQHLQLI